MADYVCPHCGELVDTDPDRGGGNTQEYVEDCPVCCRPNIIHAHYLPDDDEYSIGATAEDD
jgi:hypothetical protein